MQEFLSRIGDLAASNINQLLDKAEDPAKMLGLLKQNLQDNIINLQGELAKTERQEARLKSDAQRLDESISAWPDKAKLALQHGKDELARSALLAREQETAQAAQLRDAAGQLKGEAKEIKAAIAELESKLAETHEKLGETAAPIGCETAASNSESSEASYASDKIAKLSQKLNFAEGRVEETATNTANVDAELAELQRETRVEAELGRLKKSAAKADRKAKK